MPGIHERTIPVPDTTITNRGERGIPRTEASPQQHIGQVQEQLSGIQTRLKAIENQLATFDSDAETSEEEKTLEAEAQTLAETMQHLQNEASTLTASDAEKPAIVSSEMDQLGTELDSLYAQDQSPETNARIQVVEARMKNVYDAMEDQGLQRSSDSPYMDQEEYSQRSHALKTGRLAEAGRAELAMEAKKKQEGQRESVRRTIEQDINQLRGTYELRMRQTSQIRERLPVAEGRVHGAEASFLKAQKLVQQMKDRLQSETHQLDTEIAGRLKSSEDRVLNASYLRTSYLKQKPWPNQPGYKDITTQDIISRHPQKKLEGQTADMRLAYAKHLTQKPRNIGGLGLGMKQWTASKEQMENAISNNIRQTEILNGHAGVMGQEYDARALAYMHAENAHHALEASESERKAHARQPTQMLLSSYEGQLQNAQNELDQMKQELAHEQDALAYASKEAQNAEQAIVQRQDTLRALNVEQPITSPSRSIASTINSPN